MLHLTSDKQSPDNLYVEGENGMCEAIHADDLFKLFDTYCERIIDGKKKLNIDIVSLAIPDSVQIGQKFIELGVPHVLTFELEVEK